MFRRLVFRSAVRANAVPKFAASSNVCIHSLSLERRDYPSFLTRPSLNSRTLSSVTEAGLEEPSKNSESSPSPSPSSSSPTSEKDEPSTSAAHPDFENRLKNELKMKDKELNLMKEKYLQALADKDNLIKRFNSSAEDTKLYSIQKFAKEIITVADVTEKAIESISKEVPTGSPLSVHSEGLQLIYKCNLNVLKSFGITQMDCLGQKFDPNFHEAMFEAAFPDKEPGTVAVVLKKGYMIHNRCLRAAQVGIVKV